MSMSDPSIPTPAENNGAETPTKHWCFGLFDRRQAPLDSGAFLEPPELRPCARMCDRFRMKRPVLIRCDQDAPVKARSDPF